MGMSWNGEMYLSSEFSRRWSNAFLVLIFDHKQKNKHYEELKTTAFTAAIQVNQATITLCTIQGGIHTKYFIQRAVLTEKHPVVQGVWPAPLLDGVAHV